MPGVFSTVSAISAENSLVTTRELFATVWSRRGGHSERLGVLVIVVGATLALVAGGMSAQSALAIVGATGLLAAEIANRLLGSPDVNAVGGATRDAEQP